MAATPAQAASATTATAWHCYVLIRRAPARLHYRNGTVALEFVRDCSADLPTWVFRARRVAPRGGAPRHLGPAGLRLPTVASLAVTAPATRTTNRPLPTISPIALAAARQQQAAFGQSDGPAGDGSSGRGTAAGTVVIASSLYGRLHLEQSLRAGVSLAADSPAARVMDALVTLGYATCRSATAQAGSI